VLESSVNETIQALCLVFFWQHGDVVLEWVRYPVVLAADVGNALMRVPVVLVREGLIDNVVEVLVVGEDNVTADIVKLVETSDCANPEWIDQTYESLGCGVGGGETTRSVV